VIVVSSEFEEFEKICDRVLIFQHGRVTAEVSAADINAEALERVVQVGART
jgi:ABC-type sugar transport system ATPase subunit